MLCDQHVVKMTLESAQILSTVARSRGYGVGYAATHRNHPCVVWAGANNDNLWWLARHSIGLCQEYTRRFRKTHASEAVITAIFREFLPDGGRERPVSFVQAMPDRYKQPDTVMAYRAYYRGEKSKFARYRHSEIPEWMKIKGP